MPPFETLLNYPTSIEALYLTTMQGDGGISTEFWSGQVTVKPGNFRSVVPVIVAVYWEVNIVLISANL